MSQLIRRYACMANYPHELPFRFKEPLSSKILVHIDHLIIIDPNSTTNTLLVPGEQCNIERLSDSIGRVHKSLENSRSDVANTIPSNIVQRCFYFSGNGQATAAITTFESLLADCQSHPYRGIVITAHRSGLVEVMRAYGLPFPKDFVQT